MQLSCRLRSVLLLFVALALPATSLSAVSQARLFLRSHVRAPPSTDELAELRNANPDAYALVKALLTKRSLGLLDPMHPTAKFAGADQQHPQTAEQGPDASAKVSSPEEVHASHQEALGSQASVPYAQVEGAARHDWLNWKPQNSAANDDAMVQNVLGAVAELKGKKVNLMSKHRASESLPGAGQEGSEATSQPAELASQASSPPAPLHDNSNFKTLSSPEVSKPSTPAKHRNSYLDGVDLSGDMPQITEGNKKAKQTSQVVSSSSNYLASFSWGDSHQPAQERPHPQGEEPVPVNSKDANLMSWLGVVNKAPVHPTAPAPAALTAPAKLSNPYLADLA